MYDEIWDKKAELLIRDEVKESELEEGGTSGGKIISSELGGREGEKSEVGDREMGRRVITFKIVTRW